MAKRAAIVTGTACLAVFMLISAGVAAMPSWRLPDLAGESLGPADFEGRWVVVNYWATWCKPCREEMPELNALARANDNLAVLGVAWEDVTVDDLTGFLKKVPVDYPVLRADPFDPPPAIEAPRVLPTTVIFGPAGDEVRRFHGPVTRADIEQVVHGNGGEP